MGGVRSRFGAEPSKMGAVLDLRELNSDASRKLYVVGQNPKIDIQYFIFQCLSCTCAIFTDQSVTGLLVFHDTRTSSRSMTGFLSHNFTRH